MATFNANGAGSGEGNVWQMGNLKTALGSVSKLRLYKSSFSPSPANVEADFEAAEANFDGYAASTITWGTVGVDAAGNATMYSNDCQFQATDGTVPNTLGGAWISVQTAAGPPIVNQSLQFFPFPVPIPVTVALQTVRAVVEQALGNGTSQVNVAY